MWEHERISYGDRFVLMRVGDEKAGLVMEGMIVSDCYEDKDWAGSGRTKYYVDVIPMTAYNPENGAIYPLQSQLQEAVPTFDWNGGHSGRVLTYRQARDYDKFMKKFKASAACQTRDPSKIRLRDYVRDTVIIQPNKEDLSLYPTEDPRPVIESLIMQAMEISPYRMEEDWEKHEHVWVRGREGLLRAAAWLAYPIRTELPYYGALCLKLSQQYWGVGKQNINAAYAKEAADFLTDRNLKYKAITIWLGESLSSHQYWGCKYAINPLARNRISGLDVLSEFIGCDVLEAKEMLHDYCVRNVEINFENDYIDVNVCYGIEDDDGETLTFHIEGDIEIEHLFTAVACPYIEYAVIGRWGDGVQLFIDGYGLRARGDTIDIRVKDAQ